MPNVHYAVSPSQLKADMLCDARWTERRKYPDQPSGPSAIDGTHSHTLTEICIKNGLKDPMLYIGQSLIDHEGEFEVDFERAKRVSVAVNYVKERQTELVVCEIRAEEETNPGMFVSWDDWKGTCDITITTDKVLEVIDYKDGRSPVDPIRNEQLMSYALGRIAEYSQNFETIRLTIIQPRCNPMITHSDVSVDDLITFSAGVGQWRKRAEADNPVFTPGEYQCRWCNARGSCAAFMNQALEGVGMGLQAIDVANQAAEKEPTQWTDEQLREFIEGIPLIKQAIDAAETEAMRRWKEGHCPAGLKAVEGRGSRQWTYDEDTMIATLKKMGVPRKAYFVQKLVSPAQAEKLNWEKTDGTRHSLSARQLKRLEKEYITRKAGKVTIVPESDEREGITAGVEKLFKPVEEPKVELPSWLTGE